MNRRTLLKSLLGAASIGAILPLQAQAEKIARLHKSHEAWRALLSKERFHILFEEGTERPGSSPLDKLKDAGTFICAACYQPLFESSMKYDSGTGWPSFFDVIPGRIGTKIDRKFFMTRTEYHCSRCGGHQGHVFNDGPKPTGLRYCNNGLALQFVAQGQDLPELRS